jgi:hypothetical protein
MTGRTKKRLPAERRYQRATCNFGAEFSWGTITHAAQVRIISMGGCFLETPVLVPSGSEIEAMIGISEGEPPIRSRAKVVWVADKRAPVIGRERVPGFALEFIQMFPEDRARLEDYVRRRNRIFHAILHELDKTKPDRPLVNDLFLRVCPNESTHLNHIRKVCFEELKHSRLRP